MSKQTEAKQRMLRQNAADFRREARLRAERGDTDGAAVWSERMARLESEADALGGG